MVPRWLRVGRARRRRWLFDGGYRIPSRQCLWNDPLPVVSIRKGLDRVMGGNEQGSKVPESLEVGLTAFFKLVS